MSAPSQENRQTKNYNITLSDKTINMLQIVGAMEDIPTIRGKANKSKTIEHCIRYVFNKTMKTPKEKSPE